MTDEDHMSELRECTGDAAAYVLGALEPHEAAAFELHLEQCSVCREEVESLGGVVQALPMATAQLRAPRSLRRKVRRAVRHGSPSLERTVRRGARPMWVGALPAVFGPGRAPAAFAGSLMALAAAAVVVFSLGSGAGGTLIQAQVSGIGGSAQLHLVSGRGELVVKHLTAPGRDRVYEVWLERGESAPVPASVLFSVNSSGNADVGLPGNLRGVSAVLVTSEPLGGTQKPTREPVIDAKLA
jgi:anti-sigma-K factor RskA